MTDALRRSDAEPGRGPGDRCDTGIVYAVVVEYHPGQVLVMAQAFPEPVIRKLDALFGADVAGTRVLLKARGATFEEQGLLSPDRAPGYLARIRPPPRVFRLVGLTLESRVEREIRRCRRWCAARNPR